jgi:tetratricopeptide (TPR) repeat protein
VSATLLLFFAGCVSQPLLTRIPATDNLVSAETALDDGRYHLARMKFAMALEEQPGNETAVFGLGLSHFRLGAYENAARYFVRYLDDFSEGEYAEEARYYISEINSIQQQRLDARAKRAAVLKDRVDTAREAVERRPSDPKLRIELGSAYWDIADFARAAEQYIRAVKLDAALRDHPVVRGRMEFGPAGGTTVLTPRELERRDREANPIVISNTRGYRAGRGSFDFQYLWYVVSGQVRNRSTRTVAGVAVEAVIYNLSGHVLDVQQMYIGTMRPGAERSFSARLTHFDDINNVHRYECKIMYR